MFSAGPKVKNPLASKLASDFRPWDPGIIIFYENYILRDKNVGKESGQNERNQLLLNPKSKPEGYWKNSSDNAIIRSFIDFSGEAITQKFETLLSGGCIVQRIKEDLTYDYLKSSEENLWSILYLTGYLTRMRELEGEKLFPEDGLVQRITNTEIMEIFETTIKTWFEGSTLQLDRSAVFAAVWNGDAERATAEVSKLLRKTISYHDYREDFYHAFFAGVFAGAGYVVESNREQAKAAVISS